MKRKRDVDREVAALLDMPSSEVALITGCFMRVLLHKIVDDRVVLVEGFGAFRLTEQKNVACAHLRRGTFKKGEHRGPLVTRPRRKFRVWFKKAARFKEILEEAYGKAEDGDQHHGDARENRSGVPRLERG